MTFAKADIFHERLCIYPLVGYIVCLWCRCCALGVDINLSRKYRVMITGELPLIKEVCIQLLHRKNS